MKNQSGTDIDIWGDGRATAPRLMPRPGAPGECPRRTAGDTCPPGCHDCIDFERDIEFLRLQRLADLGPP